MKRRHFRFRKCRFSLMKPALEPSFPRFTMLGVALFWRKSFNEDNKGGGYCHNGGIIRQC